MQLRKQKLTREIILQRIAEAERLGQIKYPKNYLKHALQSKAQR